MDKMDNLIEKINVLEASLKDINFKIDNFKPFEKISSSMIKDIQEYIKNISPLLAKIIVLSDGELCIEDDKVFYRKDKRSSYSFTYENSETVLKEQADKINGLFVDIIRNVITDSKLANLGKSLVTIYNIYENIADLEKEAYKNFVSLSDLKKQKEKIDTELASLNSKFAESNKIYLQRKNKVLLNDVSSNQIDNKDIIVDLAFDDKSSKILSWNPLKEILRIEGTTLDSSVSTVKDLVLQSIYSISDMNYQFMYCSKEANMDLVSFFNKLNNSFAGQAFYNGYNPSEIINNRYFIRDAIASILDLITKRQELLSSNGIYKNIYEYNLKNPKDQQKYIFLFLQQYPTGFEDIDNFSYLLQSAAQLGIFIIAIERIEKFDEDNKRYLKYIDLDDVRNVNYLKVSVDNGKFINDGEVFKTPQFADKKISELLAPLAKKISSQNSIVTFEDIGFGEFKEEGDKIKDSISIPVGKSGNKVYNIEFASGDFGENGIVGAIITGGTGTGKSSIIDSLIFNGAMKYSPDDLNFYLIDFKDGISNAKFITTAQIPHVKLVMTRSVKEDAEIILSLLNKERIRRNKIFTENHVTNIQSYNAIISPNKHMPRIVVIIDEANQMLAENDSSDNSIAVSKLNDKLISLISVIVDQGRNAGIHLIFAAQYYNAGLEKASGMLGGKFCFANPVESAIEKTLVNSNNAKQIVNNECKNKQGVCVSMIAGKKSNDYSVIRCGFLGKEKSGNDKKYAEMIRNRWKKYEISFAVAGENKPIFFKDYVKTAKITEKNNNGAPIGIDYCDGRLLYVPFNNINTSLGIVGGEENNFEPNTDILISVVTYALSIKGRVLLIDESYSQNIARFFDGRKGVEVYRSNQFLDALKEFKDIYNDRFGSRREEEPVFLVVCNLQMIEDFIYNHSSAENDNSYSGGYRPLKSVREERDKAIKGADTFFELLRNIKKVRNMYIACSIDNVEDSIPDNLQREFAKVSSKIINSPFREDKYDFSEDFSKSILDSCRKDSNNKNLSLLLSMDMDGENKFDTVSKARFFRYTLDRETDEAIDKEIKSK